MTSSSSRDDSILLLHAYLDGELDAAAAIEMEQRIAADPALTAERDRIETLRRALRERLPREAPSPGRPVPGYPILCAAGAQGWSEPVPSVAHILHRPSHFRLLLRVQRQQRNPRPAPVIPVQVACMLDARDAQRAGHSP